jgi:dephospho-CoA kinase
VVFGDREARRDLEAIVHPAVYRAITAGLRAFERTDHPPLAVVDIPLLYETGRQDDFDRVVATLCPRPVQLSRLVARGLTEGGAEARLAAQMPAEEKAARAHHVIRTDGTLAETDAQIDAVVRLLLQ